MAAPLKKDLDELHDVVSQKSGVAVDGSDWITLLQASQPRSDRRRYHPARPYVWMAMIGFTVLFWVSVLSWVFGAIF